jgi:hypothetical protein
MKPNINPKIEKLPYRIWYRINDENGNTVSLGQSTKTYKRYSNAWNAARQRYAGIPNCTWYVTRRSPFREYTSDLKCGICGSGYSVSEGANGDYYTSKFSLSNEGWHIFHDTNICPACYLSIVDHIKSRAY